MTLQFADTNGSGLTGQPAGGVAVSNGPTRVARGVAIFAMAMAAIGTVLYILGDWEWAGLIVAGPAMIASYLVSIGTPRGSVAKKGSRRRLIEKMVGIAFMGACVVLVVAQMLGWLSITDRNDHTPTVITFLLLTLVMANPIAFAPRPDGMSEGMEEA